MLGSTLRIWGLGRGTLDKLAKGWGRPSNNANCGCVFQIVSRELSRRFANVYDPKPGELLGKQSMKKLPSEQKKQEFEKSLERIKASGEVFRSVMGELYSTKNKRLIALEGHKLVEEGLKFGLRLTMLFLLKSLKTLPDAVQEIVDQANSDNQASYNGTTPEVHRIGLKTLQDWSTLTTPPGIIGVFEKPSEAKVNSLYHTHTANRLHVPLTVVLDNIRDPGNLGSILRTAAGIGCKIFVSEGCVDPWDMKSLRGGNGAQFLVPMLTRVKLDAFHQYIDMNDLTGSQLDSEGNRDQSSTENDLVSPPRKSGIAVFMADSGVSEDPYGIPCVPYTSVNYTQFKSVFLILGGETSGLRESTRKTVADLKKIYPDDVTTITRINIPMQLPIDSLNVGNAFGVVGYEIFRQFSLNH